MAAASTTYWVLKWIGTGYPSQTAAIVAPSSIQSDSQVVARLLGGSQTVSRAGPGMPVDILASRFKLTGVVAGRSSSGYALISIDGKPAKPYRVGAQVTEVLVLHSVAPRSASLAASLEGPVTLTLELPKLAQAQ